MAGLCALHYIYIFIHVMFHSGLPPQTKEHLRGRLVHQDTDVSPVLTSLVTSTQLALG